jgi:hypothetical protein
MAKNNKAHGTINTYLSIVSYVKSSRRLLIDSSTQSSSLVLHLKAKTDQEFDAWLEHLKQHRLYYQYKCSQQFAPQLGDRMTMLSDKIGLVDVNAEALINPLPININNIINEIPFQDIINSTSIDDQFKQVEDRLVNLYKRLNSMSAEEAQNTKQSSTKTNNNKIHQSKSNPNLLKNEAAAAAAAAASAAAALSSSSSSTSSSPRGNSNQNDLSNSMDNKIVSNSALMTANEFIMNISPQISINGVKQSDQTTTKQLDKSDDSKSRADFYADAKQSYYYSFNYHFFSLKIIDNLF